MPKTSKRLFTLTFLIFAGVTSHKGFAETTVESGLNVKLTADAFPWISQVITESNLQDISGQPLPDVDQDLGLGVQGYVSGITYDVDFNRVDVFPGEQNLAIRLKLNLVSVHANDLEFKKKAGVVIKTRCEDIRISAGQSSNVELLLNLAPEVQDGRLRLRETGLQFDIPESNFSVNGPRRCDGALGVGNLISGTVHNILQRSRDQIVQSVRDRVRSTIPKIEDQINAILLAPIPISVGGNMVMKDSSILLRNRLRSIASTAAGLDAVTDISIERQSLQQVAVSYGSDKNLAFIDAVLASVAIKTQIVNELMKFSVPTLQNPIPIDTENGPAKQVFNRQSLSGVLPDLNQITLDDDVVHAKVGFGQAPTITTQNNLDGVIDIVFSIPDLRIMLSVNKDGKQMPYFDVKLATAFGLRLSKDPSNKYASLTVQNPRFVTVTGAWAPNYTPKVDIFEGDVAQILFKSVLDYLFVAQPVFQIKTPTVPVGNSHYLEIASPFMTTEAIGVTLSGK